MTEINVESYIINTDRYGKVEVLEEYINKNGERRGKFKIIDTGYEVDCTFYDIINGRIKDYLKKTYYNIGAIGFASPTENIAAYNSWKDILRKCADESYPAYKKYGANGYTVCERWLRFDLFLEDYNKLQESRPNINTVALVIDPELEDQGCKEFSYNNCKYIDTSSNIVMGKIYHSKSYGDFIPIRYVYENDKKMVEFKFIDTGTISTAEPFRVLNGSVKDKYRPSIYTVGYLGHGEVKGHIRERSIWGNMLSRCYNPNDRSYKSYGGIGVRVCERWHNFGNFLDDIKQIPGYDKWLINPDYQMDKDTLQSDIPRENRIYSKETCMFIPSKDNGKLMLNNTHIKTNRKYFNVAKTKSGNYAARVGSKNKGTMKNIGTFTNEEAAANAVDWWNNWLGLNGMLNSSIGLPYMPYNEWIKYRTNTVQMYHLVKRQMYHLV